MTLFLPRVLLAGDKTVQCMHLSGPRGTASSSPLLTGRVSHRVWGRTAAKIAQMGELHIIFPCSSLTRSTSVGPNGASFPRWSSVGRIVQSTLDISLVGSSRQHWVVSLTSTLIICWTVLFKFSFLISSVLIVCYKIIQILTFLCAFQRRSRFQQKGNKNT